MVINNVKFTVHIEERLQFNMNIKIKPHPCIYKSATIHNYGPQETLISMIEKELFPKHRISKGDNSFEIL